jgi:hypothetical protein
MTMTDAQAWLFLIGGITTMSCTLVVTVITAVKTTYVAAKAVEVSSKVDAIHETTSQVAAKVDVVHDQTNSRLTRIEEELRETRFQLATSEAMRGEAEKARVALAGEAAHIVAQGEAPPPAPGS